MKLTKLLAFVAALAISAPAVAVPPPVEVNLVFPHSEASATYELARFDNYFDHAEVTGDTTSKEFITHPTRRMVIERVSYLNATGLAADGTNYFAISLKNGSTVLATWSTLTGQEGTIAAGTWVTMTLNSTASNLILAGGSTLTLFLDETGTQTLPAGRVVVQARYIPASGVADATTKVFKNTSNRKFVVDKIRYLNGTGLAADASNYFTVKVIKGASTVVGSWSTLTTAQGTIAANTWVDLVLSATAGVTTIAADETLSLTLDETGTAALPAGTVIVQGRYLGG